MEAEIGVLRVEKKIRTRVKRQMEKTKRVLFERANEGYSKRARETEEGKDGFFRARREKNKTKLSKEAREKALTELKKLRNRAQCRRGYSCSKLSRLMVSIPWRKQTKLKDINNAQSILEADHYGLEKLKRIHRMSHFIQQKLKIKRPILFWLGQGVGKTSLENLLARRR